MNNEQIIERKINYLNGDYPDDLSEEMLNQVNNDLTLKQELEFIQHFWSPTSQVTEELPSSELSNNFYSMLDKAKKAQQPVHLNKNKSTFFEIIENFFQPRPVLQFATVLMVFTLGYYLHQPVDKVQDTAMASLQKEVRSLNSMVALSMIQKSSASERLTGVAYSKQSDEQDQTMTIALIELLNSDSSTAVRLAVIDAVNARGSVINLQDQLVDSIPKQSSALVQMGLIRLILERGSEQSKHQVMKMKSDDLLVPDVSNYLEQINQSVQI